MEHGIEIQLSNGKQMRMKQTLDIYNAVKVLEQRKRKI